MKGSLRCCWVGIILVCVLFVAVACTPPSFRYSKPEGVEITSIQLIDYDNPNVQSQKKIFLSTYKYEFEKFDEEKCTILEELKAEDFADFEADLVEQYVGKYNCLTCGPIGQGLCIRYSDGTYFVLTWSQLDLYDFEVGFVATYYEDGTIKKNTYGGIGPINYMIIAANYFQTKIA